jgi:hypothetical protein
VSISSITKANPGVVSYTGADPQNGDIVLLSVQGMWQLDDKAVRVTSVDTTSNTFVLEGVDTTQFEDFSTGTFSVVTLGTSITTATTISSSGGDFEMIDTTTIHVNARTQMPGLPNATTFTMDHLWDASDPGLIALKAASDTQSKRVFRFTFGQGGKTMLFAGYVGASLLPAGQAQQLVTTNAVITMNGTPTYYAS